MAKTQGRARLCTLNMFQDLFKTSVNIGLDRNPNSNSYVSTYRHFITYFQNVTKIGPTEFVCGAHMIYGWMPTILTMHTKHSDERDFMRCAALLEKVRLGDDLTKDELAEISGVVNNSYVGASKLLHFVAPKRYAIWDSKIYAYLFCRTENEPISRPSDGRLRDPETFLSYQNVIRQAVENSGFLTLYQAVNDALNYPVTKLRAAELVMFNNSPQFKPSRKSESSQIKENRAPRNTR